MGEVFTVKSAYQYDFSLEPLGYRKAEIPTSSGSVMEFLSFMGKCEGSLSGMKSAVMLTADRFCIGTGDLDGLPDVGEVVGSDMETAAVFQACDLLLETPCVGIRAVSDVVGSGSQVEEYASNEAIACKRAAEATVHFIDNMPQWLTDHYNCAN